MRELFGRIGWELSDHEADDCFALYERHYRLHWTLFDDVLPCLQALSQHRIGIISNGNAEQQKRKLAQTGIAAFFAVFQILQANTKG